MIDPLSENEPAIVLRTFESCLPEIEVIIESKRKDWTFKASVMCDFDDVKSIIMVHIWRKWYLYNQKRPLGGWVATIVKNQFHNILRDSYTSTSAPCSQCPCNLGSDSEGKVSCSLFGVASIECPKYEKWYNKNRHSHNVRLPVALENHLNEFLEQPNTEIDLEAAIINFHERIKAKMTLSEWAIYKCLFVENKTEAETALQLGFKTTEKNRQSGYNRMHQVKKLSIILAKEILEEHGLETFRSIK